MMKKILTVLAAVLLFAACLAGCNDVAGEGYLGGAPVFVEPIYVGEEVTTLDRVFTKDDFRVMVNYDDGSHREVTDYEITEQKLMNGIYTIYVDWRGIEGDAMIVLDMDLFTETEAAEETAAE